MLIEEQLMYRRDNKSRKDREEYFKMIVNFVRYKEK